MFFAFTGGATLLAMLAATPATAQSGPRLLIEEVGVPYGDIDLATPAGAEVMLDRLGRAARRACGRRPGLELNQGLWAAKMREYRRCRIVALEDAMARLGAPLVQAAWRQRGGAFMAAESRPAGAGLPASAPAGSSGD